MATLPAPPPSTIPTSGAIRSRTEPPPSLFFRSTAPHRLSSARLYSTRPSSNGSLGEPYHGGEELQHGLPSPRLAGGIPVFVTLPVDAVRSGGKMTRKKTMAASLMALAAAGIEGIAVEAWWGIVEGEAPGVYNWGGYMDVVSLARRFGLKVRMILAFHQCGSGPDDLCWTPLPRWVLEEMKLNPDIQFSDRFGRRSKEYISLGCDSLPILRGRTPIQAYTDFMRNFRDTFKNFLGVIITEVQIGMGPAGELRYPSSPSENFITRPELGEFQCYDKYMQASLSACAEGIGKGRWGNGGPLGTGTLLQNPEDTAFFRSRDGAWNTPYGQFFLQWYSGLLLAHGERLCTAADTIFWASGANILAKVSTVHWHYATSSRPSELTAGYYNTLTRDGYLPIARLFARYNMVLCSACFELSDSDVGRVSPDGSPEGVLRQLVNAARMCNLPLTGENSVNRLDDVALRQVVRSSSLCGGQVTSFNFVRMSKNMFEGQNWSRFTRFVRQMSDARTFQARLEFGSGDVCLPYEDSGRAFVFKRVLPCRLRLCSP